MCKQHSLWRGVPTDELVSESSQQNAKELFPDRLHSGWDVEISPRSKNDFVY